ncbi:transcription factor Adf-1-like [Macrobrachium nipponense]|uniref:transcription factor Adf-1-like n=1 Tax=Macrobrachium nipponense TaxID=159736 RepID=UPI0030C8C9FA
MDNDKLISLVYENRCLWDMRDKNYHNRDISLQKWEKIATELNTSSESAKTKWRGLRDTFRKELAKNPTKRSGDEGGIIKEYKWAYFKTMEFLKDQFQKRKLQGNVPSEATFDEDTQNSTTIFSPDPPEIEPESQTQTGESPQNTTNETPPQNFAAP